MSYQFDYTAHIDELVPLLLELERHNHLSPKKLAQLVNRHPKRDGSVFAKDQIIQGYRALAGSFGLAPFDQKTVRMLRMKPTRTISGVTPITVLTKPFPCPGKCIFCPNDVRMPKSYLADEPGAQRAGRNYFDPYLQTYNRLQALHNTGHSVAKAEIIVLGGTWSFYPETYQRWFICECFRALNEFGGSATTAPTDGRGSREKKYRHLSKKIGAEPVLSDLAVDGTTLDMTYNEVVAQAYTAPEKKLGLDAAQSCSWVELEEHHRINEQAKVRCVGLVIETRPDNISKAEVRRIRRLGCTKVQIGVQSLQDEVLKLNHRGHDVAATRRAFRLLRQAGFKIQAHWMANLYGSSVALDKRDYDRLFTETDYHPDELKIYPCSLIQSAELMQYFRDGKWQPYSHEELLEVLQHCIVHTPEYCRLSRVIRDIPSTDIVEGNKKTNFRQITEHSLLKKSQYPRDIRAREIRSKTIRPEELFLSVCTYQTSTSQELFLQVCERTPKKSDEPNKIVAFLRLSLPHEEPLFEELCQAAVIREIHVYGVSVAVGSESETAAQHLGLGTRLINEARAVARAFNYQKLAVISAVGTREYYRQRGFVDGALYQYLRLTDSE